MTLVAAGIIFTGYTLAWWGREMVRGCPVSFGDLLVPGRYKGCHIPEGQDNSDTMQVAPGPLKGDPGYREPGSSGQVSI